MANIHSKIVLKMGVALFESKVNNVAKLGNLLMKQHCDELSNAGFWIWEYENNHVFYSENFCKVLGFEVDDFGNDFTGFNLADKQQFDFGCDMINKLIEEKSNELFTNKIEYKNKKNDKINIVCSGTVFFKDGKPLCILGTHKLD